jgi:acetyl esterase/lipase
MLVSERIEHNGSYRFNNYRYCESNKELYNALVSPIYAEEIPNKSLPPILIQVGGRELFLDESLLFFNNLPVLIVFSNLRRILAFKWRYLRINRMCGWRYFNGLWFISSFLRTASAKKAYSQMAVFMNSIVDEKPNEEIHPFERATICFKVYNLFLYSRLTVPSNQWILMRC